MTLDVLVIGAGPTGLTMAAELLLHGATVRIIDAQVDRLRESRALGVPARTWSCSIGAGWPAAVAQRRIPQPVSGTSSDGAAIPGGPGVSGW